MRPSHIDVCNAVLLTGSITAAARMLNVSQPAVTKLLHNAESQIGFKLFIRDKKRLVPTEEAIALQPEVFDLASRLQRLRDMVRELAKAPNTLLRIDCVPSLAATLLPHALLRFREQHPRVSCHVETHPQSAIVERLLRRRCDIGFSLASLPNPGVVEETLAEGHGVCVAPLDTFSADKREVSWADLANCRTVRIPASSQFGGLMLEASHYTDEPGPGAVSVTTNLMAMKVAELGIGVATIDSFTAAHANRALARVLPLAPAIPVELKWLRRVEGRSSHAARRFAHHMGAVAREQSAALPRAATAPARS
jgi:DNA-binding transcriptional LysR family regulator